MRIIQVLLASTPTFSNKEVVRKSLLATWKRYHEAFGFNFQIQFVFPTRNDEPYPVGQFALELIASVSRETSPLAYDTFLPCMGIEIPFLETKGTRVRPINLWFEEALEESPKAERVLLFADGGDEWIESLETQARDLRLFVERTTTPDRIAGRR